MLFLQFHKNSLPADLQRSIHIIEGIEQGEYDAVLHHGSVDALKSLQLAVAKRKGAIVSITHLAEHDLNIPIERLVIERAISINTAAAGGNASLMMMTD
jgi:Delta 1-pyrroline-5-carboxylate dehydrogenase